MFDKPPVGTAKREHRQRQAKANRAEVQTKQQARTRDGFMCRYPWCGVGNDLVGAHLTHKGIGGDSQQIRTTTQTIITLCSPHHDALDGRLGVSKRFVVERLTSHGADGLLAFSKDGTRFAVETAIGTVVPA